MKQLTTPFALLICSVAALPSQGPPEFEVASVRVHSFVAPASNAPPIVGNRFTRTGNVNQLIMYAYDLKSYQLSGGPSWVTQPSTNRDYYDIDAIAEGTQILTQQRARQLLQTLLTQRFHLRLHREMTEMPVYALVIGKRGPKLKESAPDAIANSTGSVSPSAVATTFAKGQMSDIVRVLSSAGDRPVLDQTGLTGFFDFRLEFARDPSAAGAESNASSIFTAVQEQLGLKLESRKGPVETWVIDGVDRPSEN